MDTKLAGWEGKELSRGGILTMMNPVLSAISLNMMSFYWLMAWVRDKIDRLRIYGNEGKFHLVLLVWCNGRMSANLESKGIVSSKSQGYEHKKIVK